MAPPRQEFWNSQFETMPPATLRSLEEAKLKQQLEYAATASPFYQSKWAAAGVSPKQVRRLEDLVHLPFTEKRELQETQEACPPLGANQCAPLDRLVRMQATGGTTGRPLRMALTRRDIEVYNELGARAAWAAGLRPGDVLLECMNYSLYAGGVNDHMTFETVGACVAPVSVAQSRRLLEILQDMRIPSVLYSTPSYALHLAQVARNAGIEPAGLGLRKGLFSGDAGLAIPGYREQIECTWKMTAQDIYGMGELSNLAAECGHRNGLHNLAQGLILAELIDPVSGAALPMADGAVGELVFTTLERQAHPLIRFRSHDHVQISLGPCPCGRTGFRFRILGRSDDMFIVKGVNVFPLAVQDVICGFGPELTGEFQILLDQPPPLTANPRLRVEADTAVAAKDYPELQRRLAQRIRVVLVFTPDVELVPAGTLPRSEKKARRLYRLYQGEQPENP